MAIKVAVLLFFIFVTVSPGMGLTTGTSAAMSVKIEEAAEGQAAQDTCTITEHIEEKYTQMFAPEEMSARMKIKMKELAVPAHITPSQGSANLVAAFMAGLKVSQLVVETTAVSISYTMLKRQEIINVMNQGYGAYLLELFTMYDGIAELKPRGTDWTGHHLAYRLNDYFITLVERVYKKDIRKSKKLARMLLAKCVKAQKMMRTHPRLQLDISAIFDGLLFLDGSPLNFGINQNGILAEIIPMNTRIPTAMAVLVEFDRWSPDNRTIEVYAGARPLVKDCVAIGVIHLRRVISEAVSWEPPKAVVTMVVGLGNLYVEVHALDTMESDSIVTDINSFGKVEQMVKESKEFAQLDYESMKKAAARKEFLEYLSQKLWQLFQQDKYNVELDVTDHTSAFLMITGSRRWIMDNENAEQAEIEARMKAVKKRLDSLKVQYTPKRLMEDDYAAETSYPFDIDAYIKDLNERLVPIKVQYTPINPMRICGLVGDKNLCMEVS